MNRKKIAAGNWKMFTTLEEGLQLTRALANGSRANEVLTILGVPFTHLKTIRDMSMHVPNMFIAAQNCHHEKKGAFTGEISVDMLASLSIPYCIVGHSERRQYFSETNEQIAKKIDLLLDQKIKAIFCCGEPLEIREAENHVKYVAQQIEESLFHLSSDQMNNITIAYEPIWAIGTGVTASAEQAQEMHKAIRSLIREKYDEEVANSLSILYGGSVKPNNASQLFEQLDIDGGLVGGAALNADDFLVIINSFS